MSATEAATSTEQVLTVTDAALAAINELRDAEPDGEHLGLKVNRLIRVAYGPFQLGALPEGGLEEVPAKVLREQIGAAFFGAGAPASVAAAAPAGKPKRPGTGWAKAKPRPLQRRRKAAPPASGREGKPDSAHRRR